MPSEKDGKFTRVIRSFVAPKEVVDSFVEFMNSEIGPNGESYWDYFTGTKTDPATGKLVMNLKHAQSRKAQGYLSDTTETAVPLPDYLANRIVRLAGMDVPVGQLVPKVYLWDVNDPSAFRIDDKNAAKSLAASATFLTEHPEIAEKLGVSKETLDTLIRLQK